MEYTHHPPREYLPDDQKKILTTGKLYNIAQFGEKDRQAREQFQAKIHFEPKREPTPLKTTIEAVKEQSTPFRDTLNAIQGKEPPPPQPANLEPKTGRTVSEAFADRYQTPKQPEIEQAKQAPDRSSSQKVPFEDRYKTPPDYQRRQRPTRGQDKEK